MLDAAYFATLDGCPSQGRLTTLPLWAQTYERELRAVATWWSLRQRHKRRHPIVNPPKSGRLLMLPVWAQEWFATLRFEVYWQQELAAPLVVGPSRLKLFVARRREHKPTGGVRTRPQAH